MRTDRHARAVEIGDEAFFGCHHVERGRLSSGFELLQQGARALRGAFHLPQGITPMCLIVRIEKVQRSDFGQLHEFIFLKLGNTKDKVVDGSERLLVARADESAPGSFVQTADVAQADAQASGAFVRTSVRREFGDVTEIPLQRALPVRAHHINRSRLQSMPLRIFHQRCRAIKPHRLVVQHCGGERGQVMSTSGTRSHTQSAQSLPHAIPETHKVQTM